MTLASPARIAALVLALSAAPVMARTTAVTQANLVQSLNQAQPGDTLVLVPGGYGVVSLPRKDWQTPITIDARAATLTGLVIYKVSGVNWTGGTIIGTGYGVSIRDGARITVTGADISAAQRGIVINNATDVKILRNKLHGLRIDAIDIIGQRVLIEGNVISDMDPLPGAHPDGIQMWSANDEQTRDITVRGNTITGLMQGIFGGAPVLGMSNIVVTGNKVLVAYGNGIAIANVRDGVGTGNNVKSIANAFNKANMRIEGTNNLVCGNTVPDVPKAIANLPCKS